MGIRAFGIPASAEREARFPRCACPVLPSLAIYIEHTYYIADTTHKYDSLILTSMKVSHPRLWECRQMMPK